MKKDNFSHMLEQVALAYNTTPEAIFSKITLAITEGQQSRDPEVLALWATVPRAGDILTVEDFVEYLAQTLRRPFDP